ncbi:MAG: dolichyl-phosphate mannose synthase [Phycisphaeraceae bacterium]|nr:dolichyl-phosphate mannose synthase [Phycisphaeraceae bacterium]
MRTLVAIPVYNEQRYVTRVLEQVRQFADNVLVIDDGSTDDTPLLLARQAVEVIRHAANRGYGQSLIDAFRWAQCYRFDWLITMDCDEQHEPASLPDFHAAIEQSGSSAVDVISGSRYLDRAKCGDPPPADRRRINGQITDVINRCLDLEITDAFCGFKAYRVGALRALTLDETGYAFPLQFWVQTVVHGLSVTEIPIRLIYNDANRSFGGPLDDSALRYRHYVDVLEREIERYADRFGHQCVRCVAEEAAGAEAAGAVVAPRDR